MLQRIKGFFETRFVPSGATGADDVEHMLRLATGALLLEMVYMDGERHPEQCAAVKTAVLEQFDLDADEAAELLELAEQERAESTDYFQFTSLINGNFTAQHKAELVERLWRIAYANDVLHMHEEHLVRKFAGLLHVPHSEFIAAKHRACGGT